MLKKLLKNKIFIISVSVVLIGVLVFISVLAIQTFLRITEENGYVEAVYKAASVKYNDDNYDKFNAKIKKSITKYKKSKINTKSEINDRLLETADKVIKEKHLEGAVEILKECSEKKGYVKKKRAVEYNLAKAYFNKKEYLDAYECFEKCGSYSDSKKRMEESAYNYAEVMNKDANYEEAYTYYEYSHKKGLEKKIKEAKYQYIVNDALKDSSVFLDKYLDEDDYDIVDELGNYRYSKEIALWSEVNKKAAEYKESDVETVERRLKWKLKDPFSYIRGNKVAVANFIKGARKGYGTIKVIIGLKYYAKNSFGARIGDYHVDSVEHVVHLKGLSYKKAKKIIDMSAWDLSEKAKKTK